MMKLLVLGIAFLCGARSELVVTVNPPIMQPGVTASFSINCALLEAEEMIVASLALSRQTISRSIGQINPVERIATLRSTRPNTPVPARGFERATIFGQITSLESELGTYLKMIWANPNIEDLGTYICEATVVGQFGELVTLTAQTSVTTADLATDRLLVAMRSLEGNFNTFNQSLLELQAELDVLTFRVDALESGRVATENETTSLMEELLTTQPADQQRTTSKPAVPDSTEQSLVRLADTIEKIDAKLDTFNKSLSNLERQLLEIEVEVEAEEVEPNVTTTPEPVLFDVIQSYFASGNTSYFLFRGSQNTDTYRAQAVCESKRLYLAEISDEAEFQAVVDEIRNIVVDESVVLIAGLKREGQRVWRYQGSGDTVSFVQWGPGEPVETLNSECLALRRTAQGFGMAAIPCSGDQENIFFLCEGNF